MTKGKNTISLVKATQGQTISLDKGLQTVHARLAWFNKDEKKVIDADLIAICLGADGYCVEPVPANLMFFGTQDPKNSNIVVDYLYDGAVKHSGDDLGKSQTRGASEEEIAVNLNDLPDEVKEIVFLSTIYTKPGKPVVNNFSHVVNASITISDEDRDALISYDIAKQFGEDHSIIACSIKRTFTKWEFKAIGTSSVNKLEDVITSYCKEVEFDKE